MQIWKNFEHLVCKDAYCSEMDIVIDGLTIHAVKRANVLNYCLLLFAMASTTMPQTYSLHNEIQSLRSLLLRTNQKFSQYTDPRE